MTEPPFDLARDRQDMPGCDKVLHLNNAGTALMPRQVVEATTNYLRLEAEWDGYEAAELERFSEAIDALL